MPALFRSCLPLTCLPLTCLMAAALFFSAASAASTASAASPHLNVVTVFIDDMGWSDLSCFGGDAVRTENIDRLAAEGLRFTNFYVNSPICSPSRVALTTGCYPQRFRISSYLSNRQANRNRGMAQWLDVDAPVLARELQHAGYATGHFGKWHMGGQRDVGEAPLIAQYGFDQSLTNFEGLGPRVLPLLDAYDGKPPRRHDLGSASLGQGPIRWEDRSVVTAAFVKDAIAFIDDAQANAKPFFVNIWPDDVHTPMFPPKVLRDETDGSKRALYYAVLEAMDRQLGQLFDRIAQDAELRGRTLILVASDNGPEPGAGQCDPLRGAKTMLYEGGIRSPLIVWGPGIVNPKAVGTTNETSVLAAFDLNRSVYTLTGTALPANADLDGENLASTLLGHATASRSRPICWRRPPDRPGTKEKPNPDLAIRDGRWKLTVRYDGSAPQLFDLHTDAGEKHDVALEHKKTTERLKDEVLRWNATLPADAGDPNFVSTANLESLPAKQFVNPIGEGADPWVVRDPNGDRYLWCFSAANRGIAIHTSDRLTSLGTPHVVWQAPETGPYAKEIWAPELHFLDGHWHIYFAASDGDNKHHLAYVLRSQTNDPLGEYDLHGPLATGAGPDSMSPNIWAIDMTVLEQDGKRYAIWSGWDAPGTDRQYLYIAPMKSPTELAGPRVLLTNHDDYLWERVEPVLSERGLNEGPQVFQAKGRTSVVYSCGASWLPTYKLGLLELKANADPLDPASWSKRPQPIFQSTASTYGVGHSCFVPSPDGSQWWHVFHAKQDRDPGWRRAIYVQPMRVGRRGFPIFGQPIKADEPLALPSGQEVSQAELPINAALSSYASLTHWNYYGHQQFSCIAHGGLQLGCVPDDPINGYRSGEKWLLDTALPTDYSATVTIDFLGAAQARDAGLLFRCSGPSVGYDAQRGYFAGLIPRTKLLVVGKTDGSRWEELARAPVSFDASQPQTLRVDVLGNDFQVFVNDNKTLEASDATYQTGSVGLRVVNTHAQFTNFHLRAINVR